MAQLVEIIGVTHNPVLPGIFQQRMDADPQVRPAWNNFHLMGEKLAAARPDVVIVAAGDHLNQWFMDNMPPFVVGKAPLARGPFPHELSLHALQPYEVPVDVDVAQALLRGGYEHGVDFAFSDEFRLDHAFTMPLTYLPPAQNLPIVPLWTNVMAPPIPPARRFYDVGLAIRRFQDNPELPFDLEMKARLEAGDVEAVLREATWEKLMAVGNGTPGFLDFVLLLGVARGARPSYVALNATRVTAAS